MTFRTLCDFVGAWSIGLLLVAPLLHLILFVALMTLERTTGVLLPCWVVGTPGKGCTR